MILDPYGIEEEDFTDSSSDSKSVDPMSNLEKGHHFGNMNLNFEK